LTEAFIAKPTEATIAAYGPEDRLLISRAISLLEDDALRENSRIDLALAEDGTKVWGFQIGNVWLAFIDEPQLTVVHASVLSRFRYSAF
jgi:hypothetical protein